MVITYTDFKKASNQFPTQYAESGRTRTLTRMKPLLDQPENTIGDGVQ